MKTVDCMPPNDQYIGQIAGNLLKNNFDINIKNQNMRIFYNTNPQKHLLFTLVQ